MDTGFPVSLPVGMLAIDLINTIQHASCQPTCTRIDQARKTLGNNRVVVGRFNIFARIADAFIPISSN